MYHQMNGNGQTVHIFVADHCSNCEQALVIADVIRKEFPEVHLEIVDVHAPEAEIPEVVFATPTYLLNGKLWSLGNPYLKDVRQRLES